MRSRAWAALDCGMLLAVVVLQAFRLTGVVLHEWLALALAIAAAAHLVPHWPWMQSRLRRRNARSRVNLTLNLILFAAMTAAMVSGFAISKSLLPLHSDPVAYMKWRSLHGVASRIALVTAGLHLGLNWELLLARFRDAKQRLAGGRLVPAAIAIAVVTALVTAALWAIETRMPLPNLVLMTPDGKRIEHVSPPADFARLHAGERTPSPRGLPALVAGGILLGVACFVGRKTLRLD